MNKPITNFRSGQAPALQSIFGWMMLFLLWALPSSMKATHVDNTWNYTVMYNPPETIELKLALYDCDGAEMIRVDESDFESWKQPDQDLISADVESFLTGPDTEVYKTAEGLKAGDVVDLEGFLYWYNGANPHVTGIKLTGGSLLELRGKSLYKFF